MTDLAEKAQGYVNGSQARWVNLVDVALGLQPRQYAKAAERLGKLAGEGKTAIRRKILAIRHAAEQQFTAETIKARGQEAVISAYVKEKTKARTSPLVNFPHKLTPEIAAIFADTCQRIGRVCGLKTWDEVVEFMCANYTDLNDEELKHLQGGENCAGNRKNSRG